MPKKLYFFLALSWTAIILFFCLISSSEFKRIKVPNLDKLVHFFFHFVLTPLWFLFFSKHLKNVSIRKPLFISFLFSFFLGIAIEIAQELFTETRKADVFDVLANASGAFFAVVVIVYLEKHRYLNKI